MLRAESGDDRPEAEDNPLERRTGRVGELMPKPWQQEAIITTKASDQSDAICFRVPTITRSSFPPQGVLDRCEAGLISQERVAGFGGGRPHHSQRGGHEKQFRLPYLSLFCSLRPRSFPCDPPPAASHSGRHYCNHHLHQPLHFASLPFTRGIAPVEAVGHVRRKV